MNKHYCIETNRNLKLDKKLVIEQEVRGIE